MLRSPKEDKMQDSMLSVRLPLAIIGAVAALSGSVSECRGQGPNLQVLRALEVRSNAVRMQPPPNVVPQANEPSHTSLTPEPAIRVEPAARGPFPLEIYPGQSELQIDSSAGRPSAQSVTTAATPAAAKSDAGQGKPEATDRFGWEGAVRQSMFFLGILHVGRMAIEPESRAGLRGPFFKDYFATVKTLRGWRDGDRFIVNYVAHPMQGAVSGYVQIHNDPTATRYELGMGKAYWNSRLKAMGWAALFSTQFELGAISEASLGNVGLKSRDKTKHPMAWVDLIVTPTVGTAWLVGEDILDRYVVHRMERKVSNRVIRVLVRSLLNPSRSVANVLRIKYPWHRDTRELGQ